MKINLNHIPVKQAIKLLNKQGYKEYAKQGVLIKNNVFTGYAIIYQKVLEDFEILNFFLYDNRWFKTYEECCKYADRVYESIKAPVPW